MWQPQLTRRLRVLLHADPILGLRSWDTQRNLDTRHYDSITLTMRVLDHIIESMGLGVDADSNAAIRTLSPLMYQMDIAAGIEPNTQRHSEFASRLLDRLRQLFEVTYTDFEGTQAVVRKLELRLVEEHWASDEQIVLQLSPEAINLFLNALDLEIEDAQAALEAVIQSQLQRGRFDEAVASARDAKFRSIQFEDKIERILRETRRDIRRVDWRETMPRLLHEALSHIAERLRIENHIAESARQRLEHLVGTPEATQVASIAELMDDCSGRHIRLHTMLMDARNVFFAEQDRQVFIPRPSAHLPNLFADVLEPLLASPKRVALMALEDRNIPSNGAMAALLGLQNVKVFSLKVVISSLLRPRHEVVRPSVVDEEKNWFQGVPDTLYYSPEVQEVAHLYLSATPIRLSLLLERASDSGEERSVLEYLTLSTLQVFEGNLAMGLKAEPVGLQFTSGGFWGDDLELHAEEALVIANSTIEEQREV